MQLINRNVSIFNLDNVRTGTITGFVSNGGYIVVLNNNIFIPICHIVTIENLTQFPLTFPSVEPSTGTCSCCEDPVTNLLNQNRGRNVTINTSSIAPLFTPVSGIITDVGEGLVEISDRFIISTCEIQDFQF